MPDFQLVAPFEPTGDQPAAIDRLVDGLQKGLKHQTLLGATGTGKSLTPTEPVLIGRQDDHGTISWSLEQIGPFVDGLLTERKTYLDDHGTEVAFADPEWQGHVVVALDPETFVPAIRPVTAVSRHKSPDEMWRVRTTDGRSVTVTGDHNFVALGGDGHLEVLETTSLRPGQALPVPRIPSDGHVTRVDTGAGLPLNGVYVTGPDVLGTAIDRASQTYLAAGHRAPFAGIGTAGVAVMERFGDTRLTTRNGRRSMPASMPLDPKLLTLVGLFVAEGHVADKYATITPGPESLQLARDLCASVGIATFERGRDELGIGSRVTTELLRSWAGSHAAKKHLPGWWADLDNARLGRMLAGYFEGDGWVESRGASVNAVTKSERLANEIAYALLRFGIVARLSQTWKRAIGSSHSGALYWQISIRGRDDLTEYERSIGFVGMRKRAQLRSIIDRAHGGNVDVLPIAIGSLVAAARQSIGLLQRELGERVGMSRAAIGLIESNRRSVRRGVARRIRDALSHESGEPSDAVTVAIETIDRLLSTRWAVVSSIERIPAPSSQVYDLSVAGSETFLAGFGGLIVHNTFTIARTIEAHKKPTLVLAHNKTLAAQLYAEFREFFPDNAVEYFVSYFDYYQPEAYLPRSDTYIEKDSSRNDEIDRLRHAATHALFERRDVIIVASVSCIYGLGAPVDYGATVVRLRQGGSYRRDTVLRQLVDLQYQRNDQALQRARFRVRGDTLEFQPASEETLIRVEFFGDEVERITEVDPLTGELLAERKEVNVYPASHYVTPQDKLKLAIVDIEAEMEERVGEMEAEGRVLEAARLRQRTTFDLEMMRELGFCTGIENYSRHLSRREPGSRPWTLLDYFPPDWLLVVDESHMTIPQVVGMYKNDRTRKEILVDFGFRLPSALDNRPLTFEEFEGHLNQVVHMSATPGPYEHERSQRTVEQLIRPTGVVDPMIDVRPTDGQIDDLMEEIRLRTERGERALVTTLTKKMAEDLTDYLRELGVKVQYLHSEVDTLERVAILRDLRLGVFDVLVGINLLREGIDLPEVTLVAILDADKEGFLRSSWSLIQMIGRAARNIGGRVVMYADRTTESMAAAIEETNRRRAIQVAYNTEHGIEPTTIVKEIHDINERLRSVAERTVVYTSEREELAGRALTLDNTKAIEKLVTRMETEMRAAAKELDFERAAALRDEIQNIRLRVLEQDASLIVGRAAERAASTRGTGLVGAADRKRGARREEAAAEHQAFEVMSVTVLPAGEEPSDTLDADGHVTEGDDTTDLNTAADWLPGIRDEHEDTGRTAAWRDRPTWDRTVTPNVRRRTGTRPGSRRR